MHTKKVTSKTSLTNISKSEKVHISVTFLLITFFGCIFSKLFQRIQNQREILRIFYPYCIFYLKNFFALLSTLCTLWLQMRRKRLKKTKKNFLWMCLRIFLGNHQRVCITKLLKSLYPTAHSAGEYTATLLVRVNVMRRVGVQPPCTPTLTSQD